MAKYILTLAVLLSFASQLNAQSSFFGKKVVLELNAYARNPLIANRVFQTVYVQDMYWKSGTTSLSQRYDKINYGFYGGIQFIGNGQVSPGLQVGLYHTDSPGPEQHEYSGEYISFEKFEALKINSLIIMPTLTFYGDNIIKPAGIGHEFGLGYMKSKIVDQEYLFHANGEIYYQGQYVESQDFLEAQQESGYKIINTRDRYVAAYLMYSLKIRTPISKSLLFNYGLRYSLIVGNRIDSFNDYDYSVEYKSGVRRSLFYNFVNFNLGLTLML